MKHLLRLAIGIAAIGIPAAIFLAILHYSEIAAVTFLVGPPLALAAYMIGALITENLR